MNKLNPTPQSEYENRLVHRQQQAAQLVASFRRVGWARIALLVIGVVLITRALFAGQSQMFWWLLPVGIVSLILLGIHQRIYRQQEKARRAVAFYEQGLTRLAGNWAGTGVAGEKYRERAHPYAEDIDLFGKGSLFELLCTARTQAGEDILAAWLMAPATPAEILERQAAIEELRDKLDLREDLALLGASLRTGIHPQGLSDWGQQPPLANLNTLRGLTATLCAFTFVGLLLVVAGFGSVPLTFLLVINSVIGLWLRPRVNKILEQMEPASRDLKLLSEVMARIEAEEFHSENLVRLRTALETDGNAPSAQIAQLSRLIAWLDARRNQYFRPLSAMFFWVSQYAFAVEAWRLRSGVKVESWIAAVGEIEALMALANYSYEHPTDPFAEVCQDALLYEAEQIGHPLLSEQKVVRTDLRLSHELRLLVVSGSNMSGKSTLLRTVGTNAVLAFAGAPVRAKRLRLSPLQLGASIRIQDNLRAGASLFYAEITRLRQLMELTGKALPLLFIIDEILHGTNSHDRRIGSEAVLRGLVELGAIGLVTTHDLALTNIASEANSHAYNVHFEDHLEDGKMTFDYVLRDGVVKKSNAIELMRSVGLEV